MTDLLQTLQLEIEDLKQKNTSIYKKYKNSQRTKLRLKNKINILKDNIDILNEKLISLNREQENNLEQNNVDNVDHEDDVNNLEQKETEHSYNSYINLDDDWEEIKNY